MHTKLENLKRMLLYLFLRKQNETSQTRSFSNSTTEQYKKNLETLGFRLCVENRVFRKQWRHDNHAGM